MELGLVELTSGKLATAVDLDELHALADRLEAEDPGLAGRLLAADGRLVHRGRLARQRAGARRARARRSLLKASDDSAAVEAQVALATLDWTRLDLHDARSRL